MHRLSKAKFCKCDYCVSCGCSKWWEHHSDAKYIVPNKVRMFDDLRFLSSSLWSSFLEGVAVVVRAI
jgi:hypothetical protein